MKTKHAAEAIERLKSKIADLESSLTAIEKASADGWRYYFTGDAWFYRRNHATSAGQTRSELITMYKEKEA